MNNKITKISTLDDLEKLSPKERNIFELMADLEHRRWASWQKHLHSKCTKDAKGNLIIPKGYVENLERQIKTSYAELTEREKDYDREEVLKTWQIIAELATEVKKDETLPVFELFMDELAIFLDPVELEAAAYAYISSKCGHEGQTRDDGSRYFDHPKGAAWIYVHELGGRDIRIIILLFLHDLREDTHLLSIYRTRINFGEEYALDLRAITKLKKGKETVRQSIARVIKRGLQTIIAKLCDNLHNMRKLGSCTKSKQKKQIKQTKEVYLPMLIPALKSYGGEYIELADILEAKILEAIAVNE